MLFIGVHLSLRDTFLPTNSSIPLRDIRSRLNALVCHTDRLNCCKMNSQGEWYFPNGSTIPSAKGAVFSRNRTDEGMINLNHITDATPPSGFYCCSVMDVTNTEWTVCANIGRWLSYNAHTFTHCFTKIQLLLQSKLLMVWLLQPLNRTISSPVMSLELKPPPTSGGKMALCYLKLDNISHSLLSDCLMLDNISVRSLSAQNISIETSQQHQWTLRMLSLKVRLSYTACIHYT